MNTQTLTTDMRGRVHKTYDEPIEKVYWSISEVCQMLDESRNNVHKWSVRYGIGKVPRLRKTGRQFTAYEVWRIKEIHKAKQLLKA